MFESVIVKPIKPYKVSWRSPKFIDLKINEDADNFTSFNILKGADNFLCKQIDLRSGTSREVFKKSESTWLDLINIQLTKAASIPNEAYNFSFDKKSVTYLINDLNELVDIIDIRDKDEYEEFEKALEKFTLDITTNEKTGKFFTEGKNGLVKIVFYKKDVDFTKEDFVPVVLLEFNNEKSQYTLYTGILIYDTFTFIPSVSYFSDFNDLYYFIKAFDIDNLLKYSTEGAEDLYKDYLDFKKNPIEISARELISLMKKAGYKLALKDDNQLDSIQAIVDEESNLKIQDFFNTFTLSTGETAYDILSLNELQKIFKYNKLTLLDALAILSKEYLTFEGSKVTCDLLSKIVFNLLSKNVDRKQSEIIKTEILDK